MSDPLQPHGLQHSRPPFTHHLLEFAQVHVHCINDAIQPSHPLMPSSPSALNLSQHQGLFLMAPVLISILLTNVIVLNFCVLEANAGLDLFSSSEPRPWYGSTGTQELFMERKEGRKRERETGSERGREESCPHTVCHTSLPALLVCLTFPHYLTLRSNKDWFFYPQIRGQIPRLGPKIDPADNL